MSTLGYLYTVYPVPRSLKAIGFGFGKNLSKSVVRLKEGSYDSFPD